MDSDSATITVKCPSTVNLFNLLLTGAFIAGAADEITAELTTVEAGASATLITGGSAVFFNEFEVQEGGSLSVLNRPNCVP